MRERDLGNLSGISIGGFHLRTEAPAAAEAMAWQGGGQVADRNLLCRHKN
jgi:hypothetical protein